MITSIELYKPHACIQINQINFLLTMTFVFQVCSAQFTSLPNLDTHRTLVHADTFPCRLCEEIFYSIAGLTRHVNKHHPNISPSSLHTMPPLQVIK